MRILTDPDVFHTLICINFLREEAGFLSPFPFETRSDHEAQPGLEFMIHLLQSPEC